MGLIKKYLKSKGICKVTFKITDKEANGAKTVAVLGDFNNWETAATPMKSLKNGTFTATVDLDTNQEYHFRYLMDGERWENDWEADNYAASGYGDSENSVIIT